MKNDVISISERRRRRLSRRARNEMREKEGLRPLPTRAEILRVARDLGVHVPTAREKREARELRELREFKRKSESSAAGVTISFSGPITIVLGDVKR